MAPGSKASPGPVVEPLLPVDTRFLEQLQMGDRLFYFPPARASDKPAVSVSNDYILYSVVGLPTDKEVVLSGAFDTAEEKKNVTHSQLLGGEWKYKK